VLLLRNEAVVVAAAQVQVEFQVRVQAAPKLLQHGADKSIRGFQNKTPLEAVQRNNHAAIVALLA
jgi:hypothetical protein